MSILLLNSNALHIPLAEKSINCVVTSPPYYGLRDYGTATWEGGNAECDHAAPPRGGRGKKSAKQTTNTGTQLYQYTDTCGKCGAIRIDHQIGLEETPELYIDKMVAAFREVRRVLRDDGTLWVNIGDSYAGSGGVGNQRDDANKGNMPKFKNPNSTHITRSNNGSLKPKDMIGIPWMLAFALRADGWYLRSDIIWHKPNPMPESVTDRPTKAHEYIFLLSKSKKYYYDADAIKDPSKQANWKTPDGWDTSSGDGGHGSFHRNGREKGKAGYQHKNLQYDGQRPRSMHVDRANGKGEVQAVTVNKKTVWTIATQPYSGAHFATFPPELIEPCIKAGCPKGGIVLDPFSGSGVTALVSRKLGRHAIGLEISLTYIRECARDRLSLNALREWESGIPTNSAHLDLPLFAELENKS